MKAGLFYSVASLFLLVFWPAVPVNGDEAALEKAERAEAILLAEEGTWNSVWETVDAEGEVTHTFRGVESYTPFNGRVRLLRTQIEGREHASTAFRFYNPSTEKLYIIDVSAAGQHFVLEQEVGADTIVTDPFPMAGGTMARLRFTVIDQGEGWKHVRHEISQDDGASWRVFRHQRMEKVATVPD